MPYKRQLQGSIVWMASYYVPSAMLPADVRSPNKDKTRIKEPATNAGFPNSEKGADQLENRRKREIAAGTYSYTAQGEHTAATWVAEWTPLRAARGSKADRRRVELHFCTFQDFGKKKLREFRPSHFLAWVKHGRALIAAGKMSPKNFRNAYGVVHTMFHEAVVHEKIAVNPCMVSRSELPAKRSKKGRRYENDESLVLVWSEALPVDVRMLFCLLSFTGERVGEGCGHIWSNYDPHSTPLGALTLEWAYDHCPLKSSTDKERPRVIPVHPELASALEWWRREGWEAFYGRRPNADDPIIPNTFKKGHHTEKSIYHRSRDAFETAKLLWKGHHACRHAFTTATRRLGANPLYVERITHNAEGTTVDHYTHTEWDPLCQVVAVLPWKRLPAQVIRLVSSGRSGGGGSGSSEPDPDPEAARNGHREALQRGGETGSPEMALATRVATDSTAQPNLAANLSGRRDSNPRRQPWQGCTLPLSYSRGEGRDVYFRTPGLSKKNDKGDEIERKEAKSRQSLRWAGPAADAPTADAPTGSGQRVLLEHGPDDLWLGCLVATAVVGAQSDLNAGSALRVGLTVVGVCGTGAARAAVQLRPLLERAHCA